MNKLTKILIGATIGGGVGWFIGQIAQDYLAEKQARENLEIAEEILNRRAREIEQQEEPKPVGKKKKKESQGVAPIRDYGQYYKSIENPELTALANKYNGDVAEQVLEEQTVVELVEFSIEDDQADKDPRIISAEEFDGGEDSGYVKMFADYYDDDVLTINNEPIRNPEQLVGEDALVSFGELSEDKYKVYVLNEARKAMYEITRMNKFWVPQPLTPRKRIAAIKRERMKVQEQEEENDEES